MRENRCKISKLLGLSSKLLGPGERKKKRADRPHVLVVTVSGNAFALLSKLVGLAYFLAHVLFKVSGTGLHHTAWGTSFARPTESFSYAVLAARGKHGRGAV